MSLASDPSLVSLGCTLKNGGRPLAARECIGRALRPVPAARTLSKRGFSGYAPNSRPLGLSFPGRTRRGWLVALWDFPAPPRGGQIRWVRQERPRWGCAGLRGRGGRAGTRVGSTHLRAPRPQICRGRALDAWGCLTRPTQALREPREGNAPCSRAPGVITPPAAAAHPSPGLLA